MHGFFGEHTRDRTGRNYYIEGGVRQWVGNVEHEEVKLANFNNLVSYSQYPVFKWKWMKGQKVSNHLSSGKWDRVVPAIVSNRDEDGYACLRYTPYMIIDNAKVK